MSAEPPKILRLEDYAGGQADPGGQARPSVPLLTLDQLREQSKNTSWLVKHVVPAESVGVLYGASGTFKSFIGIDLALHIAHGLPWLGRKTRQGPVLIVAAEGGTGLWRRICAWHRVHRLAWKDAPVRVVPVSIDLGSDAILVREAAAAAGITPVFVMVDTLSQTFTGEENSAKDVAAYVREIGLQFRACWQCAVLVVHHTGYTATERPRGSSALWANSDFMFGVFRDEKEMLATVENTKQKDGDLVKPISFSLRVHELAHDDDGDPITSLVASGLDQQGDVLELMDYEASRGRGGQKHLFLELVGAGGVEEKKLRTVFYEAIDGDGDKKRQAYHRSKQWAVSNGLIEVAEGVVIRLKGGVT